MNSIPSLTRRDWIKGWLLGTASACGLTPWSRVLIAEAAYPGPAVLRLNLSDYAPLQTVGGSVQLQFSTIYPPITINRGATAQFHAVDSICTHAGCTVGRFIAANGYMRCPCHGSRYDVQGRVIQGPADQNLNAFKTSFDESTQLITVEVPNLGLRVDSLAVQSRTGNSMRLKLTFAITGAARYQVRYQSQLGAPFTPVPFSLTATGPANQTSWLSNDDGFFSVYVDATGTSGFYVVSMLLTSI